MNKIIGYQGDVFSNADYVAKLVFSENNQFFPLINSKNVIKAIKDKSIDYGIIAVCNSIGGEVRETISALNSIENFVLEDKITIPIHHSLFIHPSTEINQIKYVLSHEQALKQCKLFLENNYPEWILKETEDTAICAKKLNKNIKKDTAIICREDAGLFYNLKLIENKIEDYKNNKTTFWVIS